MAPIALRMPISRVRSVTETNMMFMTPTPPTKSEMPVTTMPTSSTTPMTLLNVSTQRVHLVDREVVLLAGRELAHLAHLADHLVLEVGHRLLPAAP